MFAAIKSAFQTRKGKRSLAVMVGGILLLLAVSGIEMGKLTYAVFFLLSGVVVVSGDCFVKIATKFMQQELDKKR